MPAEHGIIGAYRGKPFRYCGRGNKEQTRRYIASRKSRECRRSCRPRGVCGFVPAPWRGRDVRRYSAARSLMLTLRAFDRRNQLVAVYPATVSSEEKLAPTGTLRVTSIRRNPSYHYNPQYVGLGFRSPYKGYGIHGTADSSKVSKTASHGCVRLTNWNALRLAAAPRKGIPVDFIGSDISSDARMTNDRSSPGTNLGN